MMKSTLFALLGLATVLTLASPPKANAGVVIGVGVGPVYPHPYGYVVAPPRPYVYYAHPYAYGPAYVPRAYFAYGHFDRDRGWARRDWDHGFRGDYRGWRR